MEYPYEREHFIQQVSQYHLKDEDEQMLLLGEYLDKVGYCHESSIPQAKTYIEQMKSASASGVDAFFHEYQLSTQEGMAIMCLAESLLRIPDTETAHELIHDLLEGTDWMGHMALSKSSLVNASALGLHIAERLFDLSHWTRSLADPVVRASITQSIKLMSKYFVLGQTPEDAVKASQNYAAKGYKFSYDMLGEGARSDEQADRYFKRYESLIQVLSHGEDKQDEPFGQVSISVKLSALHPHFEWLKRDQLHRELYPKLLVLCEQAKQANIGLTIDAEEARRCDITLDMLYGLLQEPSLNDYDGIGIAVQAYLLRSFHMIDYLADVLRASHRRLHVRLVKGAYWDTEIKDAQVSGLCHYPVYTKKSHTDVSYLACAAKLLEHHDVMSPQFATHNAVTVSAIEQLAGDKPYEFQMLYGMGQGLYDHMASERPCRMYAPVGQHKELLPYLLRRLIENAANSSFVNELLDPGISIDTLVKNPVVKNPVVKNPVDCQSLSLIKQPKDIFHSRINSKGVDLGSAWKTDELKGLMTSMASMSYEGYSLIGGEAIKGKKSHQSIAPHNQSKKIGQVYTAKVSDLKTAISLAQSGFKRWSDIDVTERAAVLAQIADTIESYPYELYHLLIQEAGKTIFDAIDEVREAIDFLRYYGNQAVSMMGQSQPLDAPTGESNDLTWHPKGVFVCISPWNFPAAIFIGQIAAALAAGNSVIAKPAESTSLIATYLIRLMHHAGVPSDALQLLIAPGKQISRHILSHSSVRGVAFTGSTQTAQSINQTLAAKDGPIATLIAETGGQNVMIIDSTALIEQVVDDIIISAFQSAGQRCSACRVLFVQDDIADDIIELLSEAMQSLLVGNPEQFATDIGPVIDSLSKDALEEHIHRMKKDHHLLAAAPLSKECDSGCFVAPHLIEISKMSDVIDEQFGPVLHVIRYKAGDLDHVIDQVNEAGYGLTLGIHSRIESRAQYIRSQVRVGNVYVNRSMIGAVVGVQPFGGEGLSGTGFKAGGPHYLMKFCHERTYTVNTAAIGGDQALLSQ